MDEQKIKKISREFEGRVVSRKSNKTAVVLVERTVMHPRYKKRFKMSRKFPVHDERNESQVGQWVKFRECRPLSKTKRWRLVKIS
jgi:small subunit ribosomal protein S17